ncbi:glutamate decarboxylase 1-like [Papaver somniferum]|nr:glutamate decarboxylase 1-like [Papaver somniferum]
MENCSENAIVLKTGIEKIDRFNIVSKDIGVPLVAFSLKDHTNYTEFDISDMLRRFGWIVPAYTMPPDAQHITVLRVVIREDFSRTLAERLVLDIIKVLQELDNTSAKLIVKINKQISDNYEKQVQENGKTLVKKTEVETQTEVINKLKKMVLSTKTKGIC